MKSRAVHFSAEARLDLMNIYAQIANEVSRTTALRYIERIETFCDRLDLASERGYRRDDLLPGLRIVGFERRVTIAFSVEAEEVWIVRLFYGGRDWAAELSDE